MELVGFKAKHMKLERKNVEGYQSHWRGGNGGVGPNTSCEHMKFSTYRKENPMILSENITVLDQVRTKTMSAPTKEMFYHFHVSFIPIQGRQTM